MNKFKSMVALCAVVGMLWPTVYAQETRDLGTASPLVFFTDMVRDGGKLIVSYEACDEKACLMEIDMDSLIKELRQWTV